MPIELGAEVVGAAVEFVGDLALSNTGAKKRSGFRRFLCWSVLGLILGALLVANERAREE